MNEKENNFSNLVISIFTFLAKWSILLRFGTMAIGNEYPSYNNNHLLIFTPCVNFSIYTISYFSRFVYFPNNFNNSKLNSVRFRSYFLRNISFIISECREWLTLQFFSTKTIHLTKRTRELKSSRFTLNICTLLHEHVLYMSIR